MRGLSEDEILPLARFAREHDFELRFIEFMPLDADAAWNNAQVISGEEIRHTRSKSTWAPVANRWKCWMSVSRPTIIDLSMAWVGSVSSIR